VADTGLHHHVFCSREVFEGRHISQWGDIIEVESGVQRRRGKTRTWRTLTIEFYRGLCDRILIEQRKPLSVLRMKGDCEYEVLFHKSGSARCHNGFDFNRIPADSRLHITWNLCRHIPIGRGFNPEIGQIGGIHPTFLTGDWSSLGLRVPTSPCFGTR